MERADALIRVSFMDLGHAFASKLTTALVVVHFYQTTKSSCDVIALCMNICTAAIEHVFTVKDSMFVNVC